MAHVGGAPDPQGEAREAWIAIVNHSNDQFDALVDRASRQLIEHDPPQRLHAAVMSEIRGLGQRRRAPWLPWPLIASAGAVLIVALVLWNLARHVVYPVVAPAQPDRVVTEALPRMEPPAPRPPKTPAARRG